MWVPFRRGVVMVLCVIVVILALLGALGDVTGNVGLWTFGGTIGMARGTVACFLLLAVAVFLLALNGNSGPFRRAD